MDDIGIFIGGLIVGLVGGGAYGVSKNPIFGFAGVAITGLLIFGVVFSTPITPGRGDASAVLGVPGLVGFAVGLAAGWYGAAQLSERAG